MPSLYNKVVFSYAEGLHIRFIFQVPNEGPKPYLPKLLTCMRYLSQSLAPFSHGRLQFKGQDLRGDIPAIGQINVMSTPMSSAVLKGQSDMHCSWYLLISCQVSRVILSPHAIICLVIFSN